MRFVQIDNENQRTMFLDVEDRIMFLFASVSKATGG
jgi:hypothetical protein